VTIFALSTDEAGNVLYNTFNSLTAEGLGHKEVFVFTHYLSF